MNDNIIFGFKYPPYEFLSNMHYAPIAYKCVKVSCSETFYQMFKTTDLHIQQEVMLLNGYDAKRFWKNRQHLIRPDWTDIKLTVMKAALTLKFNQNNDLRERLVQTGKAELIEANHWHDNFFGYCVCSKCKDIEKQNHLGVLLMMLRDNSIYV